MTIEHTNRVSTGVKSSDVIAEGSGAQGRRWNSIEVQVKKEDMTTDINLEAQERWKRKLRSVDHSMNMHVDHRAKVMSDNLSDNWWNGMYTTVDAPVLPRTKVLFI